MVAARGWFEFLRQAGAISTEERDAILHRIRKGLIATGEAQDAVQQEANPVDVFITSIKSAVLRGDAHLRDREGNDCPLDAERFGWRTEIRIVGDYPEPVHRERGAMIGWVDRDTDALYLDPTSAYAVAQQLGSHTGRTIPTSVTSA
jgi:hypothetical protein